jgi:hypothetical protein
LEGGEVMKKAKVEPKKAKLTRAEEASAAPVSRPIEQPRPVGRPKTGKRSNEDFRSVTVYIRKDTHSDVDEILRRRRRKGLIAEGEPSDVSELVQELLADWLIEQRGK